MKTINTLHKCGAVLACALISLAIGAEAQASGDHGKSPLSRLKGNYGFHAQGFFNAHFDAAVQQTTGAVAERVGVYTFDGKGHCTIHSLANKAGLANAVYQNTEDCTYTLNKEGIGEVTAALGGKSFNTYFVLVNGDREFMFTRREGTSNTDGSGASLIFAMAKKQ
ncbi:MAG: hypothetical protein PHE55_14950 [Methylococcaceae bacterium]|nr:hypothetical protein [Methylococcaceae bacterium]